MNINIDIIKGFNNVLVERRLSIALAESISAGLIASSIASISGASTVLKGGIITYNKNVKVLLLKVSEQTLELYSAESEQVTEEMVNGLEALKLGADICLAVTGVASKPTNDYKINKEVGRIFLAVKYKGEINHFSAVFFGGRNEIREQTVYMALSKVLEVIS